MFLHGSVVGYVILVCIASNFSQTRLLVPSLNDLTHKIVEIDEQKKLMKRTNLHQQSHGEEDMFSIHQN